MDSRSNNFSNFPKNKSDDQMAKANGVSQKPENFYSNFPHSCQIELAKQNGQLRTLVTLLEYHCEVYKLGLKSIKKILKHHLNDRDALLLDSEGGQSQSQSQTLRNSENSLVKYRHSGRVGYRSAIELVQQRRALEKINGVIRKTKTFINGYSLLEKTSPATHKSPTSPVAVAAAGANSTTGDKSNLAKVRSAAIELESTTSMSTYAEQIKPIAGNGGSEGTVVPEVREVVASSNGSPSQSHSQSQNQRSAKKTRFTDAIPEKEEITANKTAPTNMTVLDSDSDSNSSRKLYLARNKRHNYRSNFQQRRNFKTSRSIVPIERQEGESITGRSTDDEEKQSRGSKSEKSEINDTRVNSSHSRKFSRFNTTTHRCGITIKNTTRKHAITEKPFPENICTQNDDRSKDRNKIKTSTRIRTRTSESPDYDRNDTSRNRKTLGNKLASEKANKSKPQIYEETQARVGNSTRKNSLNWNSQESNYKRKLLWNQNQRNGNICNNQTGNGKIPTITSTFNSGYTNSISTRTNINTSFFSNKPWYTNTNTKQSYGNWTTRGRGHLGDINDNRKPGNNRNGNGEQPCNQDQDQENRRETQTQTRHKMEDYRNKRNVRDHEHSMSNDNGNGQRKSWSCDYKYPKHPPMGDIDIGYQNHDHVYENHDQENPGNFGHHDESSSFNHQYHAEINSTASSNTNNLQQIDNFSSKGESLEILEIKSNSNSNSNELSLLVLEEGELQTEYSYTSSFTSTSTSSKASTSISTSTTGENSLGTTTNANVNWIGRNREKQLRISEPSISTLISDSNSVAHTSQTFQTFETFLPDPRLCKRKLHGTSNSHSNMRQE